LTLTHEPREAHAVVVGLDREITYDKLARATLAIGRGAEFLTTNTDRSFPSERGLEPGAGALVAAIAAATGVEPRAFGKPEPALFEQALAAIGTRAAATAMIGDRHETDIVGAARVGLVTIALTTGVSDEQELRKRHPAPHFIFESLRALHRALVE
jgi:4-nitrophenyl phosphatase